MRGSTVQSRFGALQDLAAAQHGAVARRQLLERGVPAGTVDAWLGDGRLHPVHRGVYAFGRPGLGERGRWSAAVLSCGPGATLSDYSALGNLGVRGYGAGPVHVTVPTGSYRRRPGVVVHRRALPAGRVVVRAGLPTTCPVTTAVHMAARLGEIALERLVDELDTLDLVGSDGLLAALAAYRGLPGVRPLRTLLERHAFSLTDSELEQWFMRIVRREGWPTPLTRRRVNGYRVDFHWPDLGLVVEADGLRYHRTAAQQRRALERDHAHRSAGLEPWRFSHFQIRRQPGYVAARLGP